MAATDETRQPRYTECRTCEHPGEWVESPGGSWWAHLTHPADGHDFDAILHYTDERTRQDAGWWLDVQAHDRDALVQILWRSAMPGFAPLTPDHEPDWADYLRRAEQLIEDPFGDRPAT